LRTCNDNNDDDDDDDDDFISNVDEDMHTSERSGISGRSSFARLRTLGSGSLADLNEIEHYDWPLFHDHKKDTSSISGRTYTSINAKGDLHTTYWDNEVELEDNHLSGNGFKKNQRSEVKHQVCDSVRNGESHLGKGLSKFSHASFGGKGRGLIAVDSPQIRNSAVAVGTYKQRLDSAKRIQHEVPIYTFLISRGLI
jgi:hypothetical protein